MTRIDDTLSALREKNEAAFMPFIVIGDPSLDDSFAYAEALLEAGADVLEFGLPFSDPPADGPTIQAADLRALASGTTPTLALDWIRRLRQKTDVPFALLIYYNLIMQFGVDRFYEAAHEAGVDAILVADLSLEEIAAVESAAQRNDIHTIFIVSELTTPERLELIARRASGYLYLVTTLGVTGVRNELGDAVTEVMTKIRGATELPVFAGFGISSTDDVQKMRNAGVDGVIVGSALVRLIGEHEQAPEKGLTAVREKAAALKDATR